ncbi:MAG TPA: FHA domain-containing protein [Woeseiaceae bacterium]|nr:FHA domain-containing protein [Woeseiaceae bacterium]
MANENNNINELVADDDPTVELEMGRFHDEAAESDARTFDASECDSPDELEGVTVSELQSDLRSRKETIDQLQYDIQQLHTKWLGLEAEIKAREAQTEQINAELEAAQQAATRKEKLIKKRDRSIKSLKAEIRQRDEEQRNLSNRCEDLEHALEKVRNRTIPSETVLNSDQGLSVAELQMRLERSGNYADTMRIQLQDLIEVHSADEVAIENLTNELDSARRRNLELLDEQLRMKAQAEDLQAQLADIQSQHQEEVRVLRFELGEAQDTRVETEDLNSQLASDLVDAQGFKLELEKMLNDTEEQAAERIENLRKENSRLQQINNSLEQKLSAKSEAITVLLAELAKKSEPIEAIGEIEDVIHDMGERMTERSSKRQEREPRAIAERLSRVLIGTVDDQVLRFPLFKDRLTIGRTKDNDIQLEAAYISRRHAVIQTDDDATRVIDWGSKNGIYVNGDKVDEHFLCHGDIVTIGNARFRYEELKKRES